MKGSMFVTVVLTLGLAACSGIKVITDYNPETDLTQYETFAWMEGTGRSDDPRASGDLMDRRFRRAIEAELVSRGLQKATSGAPDMFVGYQLALDDKVDYQTMNSYWGSGWGYRGVYRAPMPTSSQTYAREYTVGTLVIDIFDGPRHELVWRGAGEGKVDVARNPQERQERINQAVYLIMEDFPSR